MSTKLIVFVAALIVAGPVLAANGGGSGGSSSGGSSGGGHSGGGGGGGGGHSGGGGGGHGASGLGGHAAAFSARGAALGTHGTTLANRGATRVSSEHPARAISGMHATGEHTASKLAGADQHHHRPFCREPLYDNGNAYPDLESIVPCDVSLQWLSCLGPTKSRAGSRQRS